LNPADAGAASSSGYPVRLEVEYPPRLSRVLLFVKWLLAIPHLLVLWILLVLFFFATVFAFFSILLTKRYPRRLFDFSTGVYRWYANVGAYMLLLRDEYPPFSLKPSRSPVLFEVDYQDEFNRWLPLVKWLFVIPSSIVATALIYGVYLLLIPTWLVILVTGKIPRMLFDFTVGAGRWYLRAYLYTFLMTDKYPPWTMEASPGATRLAWVVAPAALALYILLSVLSSAITEPSVRRPPPDLSVGDCVAFQEGGAILASCAGPHDARVVEIWLIPDRHLPDERTIDRYFLDNCPVESNAYLYPTEQTWAVGDREIVCLRE
jgi:hypothetical protein